MDKERFKKAVKAISSNYGVLESFIEKDFWIDVILSEFGKNEKLSKMLIFKGGTCLSKGHMNYFRLSEDIDFSVHLGGTVFQHGYEYLRSLTNSGKRNFRSSVADELIAEMVAVSDSLEKKGMMREKNVVLSRKTGQKLSSLLKHNESKFLRFGFEFDSVFGKSNEILVEIAFSEYFFPPKEITLGSQFGRPTNFTSNDFRQIFCEKFSAMTNRSYRERRIAVRDFYDVWSMFPKLSEHGSLIPVIAKIYENDFESKSGPGMVGLFDLKHDSDFLKSSIFQKGMELVGPAGIKGRSFLNRAVVDKAFSEIFIPIQREVKEYLGIPDSERLNDGMVRIFQKK